MRILMIAATLVMLFGPATALTAYALLAPAYAAGCEPGDTAVGPVGAVPVELTATTTGGTPVSLDRTQLRHAATIISTGSRTQGVGRDGILIALMAALTESHLRMLANPGAYPDSTTHPHDGTGQDHDSLGMFQMRPAAGWGTVAQLMDPAYQASAFFGGPTGPNHGSPRGLLDIPDWQQLPKGAAAQAVEVSAYPDRYAQYEPVARAILEKLTTSPTAGQSDGPASGPALSSRVVFPLPADSWTRTSGFGQRGYRLHAGVDYAAPAGTPVLALADGVVASVETSPTGGNMIVLDHTIAGPDGARRAGSAYLHLRDGSTTVAEGDTVTAGAQIAQVGSTGRSTGPHLHLEVRPGGPHAAAIDPEPWLTAHSPTTVDGDAVLPATSGGACLTGATP
ncbi:peptidase M23-like protein [Promicromonospora sp. AC04]|uniref:M23 family metallopeptidase n=1 Tax=Promicromonospora sp. AC04 TaxID=2135723 RepID=UPI000D3513F3|nr:M23 family metallopeptidase [Promicromonospora sp. AC04]PUB20865.1 peptidase M23-like protein [Promicromonospora sp. AC04]